jgi:hypothetical protein
VNTDLPLYDDYNSRTEVFICSDIYFTELISSLISRYALIHYIHFCFFKDTHENKDSYARPGGS